MSLVDSKQKFTDFNQEKPEVQEMLILLQEILKSNPLYGQMQTQDAQDVIFLNTLITAMSGRTLLELAAINKLELVLDYLNIFEKYLIDYTKAKYDQKDVLRVQRLVNSGDKTITEKFAQTSEILAQAFQSFVENLSQNLNLSKSSTQSTSF